ncbi:MAG: MMPL family transporter [Clostridia bacterium]|nr:MMPL family transporter [Clostridia bacterium]
MIKKLSNFIVNKRIVILVTMLILAVASIVCSQFVEINEDMTKYLPDDSNMKAGLTIMEEEFPEMETSNTIRVMFDDLTQTQKETVLEELGAITYVDSVDYDAQSSDYNKDNHTLYVLNMSYDYGSDEEKAIEAALESQFAEYTMVWKNDDTGLPHLPFIIIATALAVLLIILFVMCGSWIEPFLFLVVIGVAVVINSGTNLILGSVAGITDSISAILQLVLSMDYSIILMNRYRQEKELEPDSKQAMKNALTNSFSSVASSSFTTVVGLIMLVFMSFKIGANLGIVMAKGVFISMVCVLTMLPGIILACDKLIQKTAKKSLHIPMNWAAKFSYKMRYVMTGLFVVLFIGAYILQQQTGISYTLTGEDKIADIFPKSNTVVMVYENQDEDKVNELIADLDKDENIKSVLGYGTILGKPYTSGELAETLGDMGEDISLNSGVIDMLYYDYYNSGKIGTMTAAEFLSFISDTVMNDETFSDYIDDDMKENVDMLEKFADAKALTAPMTADELADFFGIDADTVDLLFVYYYASSESYDPGTMTLPEFVSFLQNDIANDPAFSTYLDDSTMEQVKMLASFTDKKALQTQRSTAELSSMLGIDESLVKTIFILHNAQDVSNKTMSLSQFTSFLNSGLLSDPMFASSFDDATKAQLKTMDTMIKLSVSGQKMDAATLAGITGMQEAQINAIFAYQAVDSMTLPDFLNSALQLSPDNAQLSQLNQVVKLAASGTGLDTQTLAQTFGMEKDMIEVVFRLYYGSDISNKTMSMEEAVDFILADPVMKNFMDNTRIGQLQMMQQMIKASVNGTKFTYSKLSDLLGMDGSMLKMLYTVKASENGSNNWSLTVENFIEFILDDVLSDDTLADKIDTNTSDMLSSARTMVNAVISGDAYTAAEMGTLLSGLTEDLESSMVELMYLYAESSENADPQWTMTLETLFNYMINDVLKDSRFESVIDADMRQKLLDAQGSLDEGKQQLVTDKYSRLIITSSYPDEGEETTAFFANLEEYGNNNLNGKYYLVGNSAMNYEMQKTFDNELLFITLLTAFAIFLIVAFTFKSISIPLILVLLVQCGVYITVTITGLMSGNMYYLALLIVECILMGATVDYGILLTNYYCEARKTANVKEALKMAYSGSIHTIMTSGLILVLVTAVVGGMFENPTVTSIVKTISIGSLCATILILFVLPGVLAACDKIVTKKRDRV